MSAHSSTLLSSRLANILYKFLYKLGFCPCPPFSQEDVEQHRNWSRSVLSGIGEVIRLSVTDRVNFEKVRL